jgi:hypothetical protein
MGAVMPELSAVVLMVGPLVLVVLVSLFLLRTGMAGSDLTEASRQKFVGCGFFLLLVGLAASVGVFTLGLTWLLKITPLK